MVTGRDNLEDLDQYRWATIAHLCDKLKSLDKKFQI